MTVLLSLTPLCGQRKATLGQAELANNLTVQGGWESWNWPHKMLHSYLVFNIKENNPQVTQPAENRKRNATVYCVIE